MKFKQNDKDTKNAIALNYDIAICSVALQYSVMYRTINISNAITVMTIPEQSLKSRGNLKVTSQCYTNEQRISIIAVFILFYTVLHKIQILFLCYILITNPPTSFIYVRQKIIRLMNNKKRLKYYIVFITWGCVLSSIRNNKPERFLNDRRFTSCTRLTRA